MVRTVEKRCEMTMAVRSAASWRNRSKSSCSAPASMAAVGSSRRSTSAVSRMKPRATATFCHWPAESSWPDSNQPPSTVSYRCGKASTNAAAPPRRAASSMRGRSSTCSGLPSPMFSAAVNW